MWACPLRPAVLLIVVALVTAPVASQYDAQGYVGDNYFLYSWAQSIPNWPLAFWDETVSECPSGNWFGITCSTSAFVTALDLRFSSFPPGIARLRGPLGYMLSGPIHLDTVILDDNAFYGSIPVQLAYSSSIKSLSLEGNHFTGAIPSSLCDMNLTCLHLSNNRLSGPIPKCLSHFPCADFAGNRITYTAGRDCQPGPKSCTANLTTVAAPPPPPAQGGSNTAAILGGVIGGTALLTALVVGLILYRRHEQHRRRKEEERKLAMDIETQVSTRHFGTLRRFTVEELTKATDHFNEDNLLGEGGYAKVYKGKLEDGKVVAVKRIKEEKKSGAEVLFLNEVELISKAVHRNLLHAEGFCVQLGECMLVLPFMPNGSVGSRTRGKEGDPMNWATRQMVARGAAEGIAYLHEDCNPKIIHRDVKADNVLLGAGDEPKIADFGLARGMEVKETHASTAVQGTLGHIAPEYFESGQLSEKTDVFAFGVFLLELVSGKDVLQLNEEPEKEELSLRDWVIKLIKEGKSGSLVDPELPPEEYSIEEVEYMLQVALVCMLPFPTNRPTMGEVTKALVTPGLAEHWEQWQAEAKNLQATKVVDVVNQAALWDADNTTGISLDAFQLSGPR